MQEEFGNGFDVSNLCNMRTFYLAYPKQAAVRPELSWTHYRRLIRIDNHKRGNGMCTKYLSYLPGEEELRNELERELPKIEKNVLVYND